MTMRSTALPEAEPRSMRARISVLAVADEQPVLDRLETGLHDGDRVAVRTATTLEALPDHCDDVDCLVLAVAMLDDDSVAAPAEMDANTNTNTDSAVAADDATLTATSVADVLDRIRQHAPELPIVVVSVTDDCEFGPESDPQSESGAPSASVPASESRSASERDAAVVDAVHAHQWTEYVPRLVHQGDDRNLERLHRRIRALVERRRLDALSRRSLASIELAQDPIAIVGPDDTLEFVNRWFAMQFGYDRAELTGRSWQACFPDETVAHLESTAIPTVADGWRWTGRCTARRNSGDTFAAHVRLGGLEDGSLVFVVDELDESDDS